jgi:putative transposase
VLVSFAYVTACRLFALVLLLARSDRSKELELLVLRHELSILRRRARRPQLTESDRLCLAALSRVMPRRSWQAFLVTPDTPLRWHRRIVARRWTYPHKRPGRPPIDEEVRQLILRLARENGHWGYVRIAASYARSGSRFRRRWSATCSRAPASRRHPSAPPPAGGRSCANTETRSSPVTCSPSTPSGCGGCTCCSSSRSDTAWMSQQARNLLMDLADRSQRPGFLIHDRDTKFGRAFDSIFRSEGVEIVRTPTRAPNANAHAERWVGSVRRECLDRLLIFGRRQLDHVLRIYIRHFNQQRPHRALELRPPDRDGGSDPSPTAIIHPLQVSRRDLLGGLLHEYEAAA